MPKLIEDVVEVKPDDVEVVQEPPIDELEWTKDAEGVYRHDHFRIVPSGGKFALEVVEGKSKRSKATQACKGPLRVCKGFALDISEGRLVKLESGNYGAPLPIKLEVKPASDSPNAKSLLSPASILTEQESPPIKAPEEIVKETDEALESVGISVPEPSSPVKTPAVEVAASILGLSQAIALLSHEHPISCLPPGSHFSQGGRFGTFIEMIGLDAKVEWEGKTTQWSGASPVKWAAERPGGEVVKKPSSPRAPLPTREEVRQQEKTEQANQAAQSIQAPSLQAESIF